MLCIRNNVCCVGVWVSIYKESLYMLFSSLFLSLSLPYISLFLIHEQQYLSIPVSAVLYV